MQILLESYTLVKRITHHNPLEVNNAVMTISWNDEDNDPFKIKMRNIQTFKNALNLFPRLAKALGLRSVIIILYLRLMQESKTSLGAGIGLIAGIIIGNVTNNVGLWIALGLCFGAGIGEVLEKKQKKESKED